MGPDQPTPSTPEQFTQESQVMRETMDKLRIKNHELGGNLLWEFGSGEDAFLLFRHPGEKPSKQLLMVTQSGFKLIESPDTTKHPNFTNNLLGHMGWVVEQNKVEDYRYDDTWGSILGNGAAYTQRNPQLRETDVARVGRLIDGDRVQPKVVEDLIIHNRRLAESEEIPKPQVSANEPQKTSEQVAQKLDELLG